MTAVSSPRRRAVGEGQQVARGLLYGLVGVVIFAGSLPATRAAVLVLDPWFVSSARAAGAAALGIAWLVWQRAAGPRRRDWPGLLVVAASVVVGFPVLTGLAMQWVTASHGILFVGLIPLATCLAGAAIGTVRPRGTFWFWAMAGAASVAGYAVSVGGGHFSLPDLLMLAAIAACGAGYAVGARLAQHMAPAAVISWALVASLPLSLPAMAWTWPAAIGAVPATGWAGLGYVTVFSMFVGFLFWYRGLVLGGTARVSQVQLFQPFIGLILAAICLGEPLDSGILLGSVMVTISVAQARRHA